VSVEENTGHEGTVLYGTPVFPRHCLFKRDSLLTKSVEKTLGSKSWVWSPSTATECWPEEKLAPLSCV